MVTKNKASQHLEHGDVDTLPLSRANFMHKCGVYLPHGPKCDTPIGNGSGALGGFSPIYHVRQPGNPDSALG